MSLSLRAECRDDDTALISVGGELEYGNAQQIPGVVHAAIVRWSPRAVFIDVAAVTRMDDAGIGALPASSRAAASV